MIQLYARALSPGLLPRKAILAGFVHVTLEPGESRLVSVPVDPDAEIAGDRVEYWLSITGAS